MRNNKYNWGLTTGGYHLVDGWGVIGKNMRDDWRKKAKVGFIFCSLIWKPFCKEIKLHRPIQAQPAQKVVPLPCEIAMQGLSIQQIGRNTFPTGHFVFL